MNFSSFSDIVVMPYKAHIVSAWYHLCIISQHFYIKRKKDRHNMKTGNDLGRDSVPSLVLKLAIPTMVAQFVNVLYSIIDRMYIGHIPEYGRSGPGGSRHTAVPSSPSFPPSVPWWGWEVPSRCPSSWEREI